MTTVNGVRFAILAANILPTTFNVLAAVIWVFYIVPAVDNIILCAVDDVGVLNIVWEVVKIIYWELLNLMHW